MGQAIRKIWGVVGLTGAMLLIGVGFAPKVGSTPQQATQTALEQKDRSPIDLALSADGRRAVVVNATSDSASLVDLEAGRVLSEVEVGKHPFAVALTHDGKRAVVTDEYADSISLLDVTPSGMKMTATIPVGDEPRGVALNQEGTWAFVALAGENSVACVDLIAGKVTDRIAVGTEPWHLALTPDGKHLAVGCARSQEVCVLDIATHSMAYRVELKGHNVRHVAISGDGKWAYTPHTAEKGRPTTETDIHEGWVIGSRLSRASLMGVAPREAIALDTRGQAVGDVDGVALSPDGTQIALTAGGTHELLLLRHPLPFVALYGPADHIDSDLLADKQRFRRVPLGGRPLGASFAPDGRSVVVANYLSNSIQVVDTQTATVVHTISLGGTTTPSLARKGEALFFDADRSFHHWYSCNSCHVEGHTNGALFDTFNDGSYDTPKKVLSLRGVTQTGPWTWHGWQKSLRQLAHDSMVKSMQGPEPTDAELDAMLAYLATLDFKPNPNARPTGEMAIQVKRGETVFKAKGCDTCHAAPNYTTPNAYDVGMEESLDPYKGFNPPSLRGVYNRAPYLHTGEAKTLERLLTRWHKPSKLTGKPDCTQEELADMVAFLKTL